MRRDTYAICFAACGVDLHERDDENSDYEGMSCEELEVLRLEKRIKRPAKDSNGFRKIRKCKRW